MRPRAAACLLALTSVLAGCAVGPDVPTTSPPQPTPRPGQATPSPSPVPSPVPSPPGASADAFWTEGWEVGATGWAFTGSGATRDCAAALEGSCSLRMAPACCRERVIAERAVGVALDAPVTARFAFRADRASGDTDTELRLVTDREHVVFAPTRPGTLGNNGMSLGPGGPDDASCGAWTARGAWHSVTIAVHGPARQAWADVHDATGARIGSCEQPIAGTKLLSVRIDGVDYGTGAAYHYDRISLAR